VTEQGRPSFSIVIPTRERPRHLASCLRSLAELEYPRHLLQVVVVDDGGSTDLRPAVEAVAGALEVTLLRQTQGGPSAARNLGASQCSGQLLAFTDDDCRPATDWLVALAARFTEHPDCAVGGRTLNGCPDNPYSAASQLIQEVVYRHYNADPQHARFLATNNLAVPAEAFQSLGGFDQQHFPFASEDREFCDRWRFAGNRLVYAPEALVYHAQELTLRLFMRQHFRYGQGAFRFHQVRALRGSGRLRDEFGFHGRLPQLLRPSLATLPPWQVPLAGALLLVWQAANATGYAWESLRHIMPRSEDMRR
jgi:GT2 family glycosyltransferase